MLFRSIEARQALAEANAAELAAATRDELLQIQGLDANRTSERIARITALDASD